MHRDLKPDNIIVDPNSGKPTIIDFGLSKDIEVSQRAKGQTQSTYIVGSRAYMAPEILEEHYHSYPCDMWSMGVILYQTLSGELPFPLSQNMKHEILNSPVLFLGPQWERHSTLVKSLISGLLNKDSTKRLTAEQALKHPWFKQLQA